MRKKLIIIENSQGFTRKPNNFLKEWENPLPVIGITQVGNRICIYYLRFKRNV